MSRNRHTERYPMLTIKRTRKRGYGGPQVTALLKSKNCIYCDSISFRLPAERPSIDTYSLLMSTCHFPHRCILNQYLQVPRIIMKTNDTRRHTNAVHIKTTSDTQLQPSINTCPDTGIQKQDQTLSYMNHQKGNNESSGDYR